MASKLGCKNAGRPFGHGEWVEENYTVGMQPAVHSGSWGKSSIPMMLSSVRVSGWEPVLVRGWVRMNTLLQNQLPGTQTFDGDIRHHDTFGCLLATR